MTLTLVGMGCGSAATLTEEGRQALLQADLLIGASRLLEDLPEGCTLPPEGGGPHGGDSGAAAP